MPAVLGTDEELSERLRTHDDHVVRQRQRRTIEVGHQQDAEDDLAEARAEHVSMVTLQGQLRADEKVYGAVPFLIMAFIDVSTRLKNNA